MKSRRSNELLSGYGNCPNEAISHNTTPNALNKQKTKNIQTNNSSSVISWQHTSCSRSAAIFWLFMQLLPKLLSGKPWAVFSYTDTCTGQQYLWCLKTMSRVFIQTHVLAKSISDVHLIYDRFAWANLTPKTYTLDCTQDTNLDIALHHFNTTALSAARSGASNRCMWLKRFYPTHRRRNNASLLLKQFTISKTSHNSFQVSMKKEVMLWNTLSSCAA